MSSKLTLTIKDFPVRGANFTFKISSANIGQKMVGSTFVPRLIVTRKLGSYSPRFWMMANLRKVKPNDASLWLPQLTVTQDSFAANGKFFSGTTIDFFDAVIEDFLPIGKEEKITFSADRKSGDFTISNIEIFFD